MSMSRRTRKLEETILYSRIIKKKTTILALAGKGYRGHSGDNRGNMNMDDTLNNVISILHFLGVIRYCGLEYL